MVMCVETAPGTPFDMFPFQPNSFSEGQWMPNSMASVSGFDYDSGGAYATSPHHHHHQHHQNQHSQHQHQDPNQRRPPNIEVSPVPPHMVENDRPKSSPSAFGNNPDEVAQYEQSPHQQHQQQQQHPHQHHQHQQPRDDPSRYAPNMNPYGYPPSSLPLSPPTSTTAYLGGSDMASNMAGPAGSMTRASPVPIAMAPNPAADTRKRKRTASTPERPPELTDEEKLLLKLKEDENLPWKDIAARFQQDIGKTYQVPALQMRFKRLRERIRVWTENDAYEYWEKHQFEIIANKMLDFGCPERFPAKAVQRKWEELHADKLAAQQQPFSLANAAGAAAFAYPGSHGILPSQHGGFIRHLPVGAAAAPPGIGPFSGPRPTGAAGVGNGQYLFGQQPVGPQPLLSPAAGTVAGSSAAAAAASIYGTSPLLSSGGKYAALSGGHGAYQQQHQQQQHGNGARSASIPTPRSAGTSPVPFTAADDAAVAAGTTSITEVGGVNMGLGLGLSMSPGLSDDQLRPGAGRQRSFSSMH